MVFWCGAGLEGEHVIVEGCLARLLEVLTQCDGEIVELGMDGDGDLE